MDCALIRLDINQPHQPSLSLSDHILTSGLGNQGKVHNSFYRPNYPQISIKMISKYVIREGMKAEEEFEMVLTFIKDKYEIWRKLFCEWKSDGRRKHGR